MGGSVFTSGANALYTPRMPPAVYTAVRDRCHAILFGLFALVATPVEGPGKADFGDVDILMTLPHNEKTETSSLLHDAATRLGAVRTSVVAHEGKASLAMPWPVDFLSQAPQDPESGDAHIQVDLTISPSIPLFHWALFKHAHGDLWNILGSAVLRPLGLTVDERALWLRVPEIEKAHRNRAKIFLTDEPAAVLHFLGLSVLDTDDFEGGSLWEKPFSSTTSLFAYATTSRFFLLPDYTTESENAASGVTTDLSALKANDRRRLLYRPLFRQWATEYVPALTTANFRGPQPPATRESVRDAAYAYFPGTEAQYEAARTSWLRERHLLAIRTAAKESVPAELPSQYRGLVCSAVRKHLGLVMDNNDGDNNAAEDSAAKWTVDGIKAHVAANWTAISEAVFPVEHAQYRASQEAKSA
ncbi:hypothetical protein SEUCBS139899_007440 [Sporothrix eucalyptigena]